MVSYIYNMTKISQTGRVDPPPSRTPLDLLEDTANPIKLYVINNCLTTFAEYVFNTIIIIRYLCSISIIETYAILLGSHKCEKRNGYIAHIHMTVMHNIVYMNVHIIIYVLN